MIHNLGLGDFYTRKSGVITSKVDSNVYIIEELFSDCIASNPDGTISVVFYVTSVRCAACVWLVENIIRRVDGVSSARINYATYRATVDYDPSKISLANILLPVAQAGYPVVPENPVADDSEKKDIFFRFLIGALFTMQLMMYSIALYAGYFQDMSPQVKYLMKILSWFFATPVVFYTGWPFFKNSYKALKSRHTSMDVLVAIGAGSAYLYSIAAIFLNREVFFDTSATILTLITLGRFLEISAKHKAKSGLLSLFSLAPNFARLLNADGSYAVMPAAKIMSGDTVQVLAGDRVPVDGVITNGYAAVDESMLTGEPDPKGKGAGDEVFAGTVNKDGIFTMQAVSVGKNTVLSRIIKAVESADISKTHIVSLADRISGVFVPFVITVAVITFFIHFFMSGSGASAIMNSVSVLVVACPCALGLAVPLAVNAAISGASSMGVLIKNGDIFEVLSKADTLCFDKTGTLTIGEPIVEGFHPQNQYYAQGLAAAAESHSKHPLAVSISSHTNIPAHEVIEYHEEPGQGVSALLMTDNGAQHWVKVGRPGFINAIIPDIYSGKTIVCVEIDNKFIGFYTLSDPLRDDSVRVIRELADRYAILILSGDNNNAVMNAAVAIDPRVNPYGGLSPFDKADFIKKYQSEGQMVVMVGDGINDAPALRQANAGIAVGHKISDIAVDTADAVLMRADLSILNRLLTLSRKTGRIVKENLAWAFSYNIIAIPLAVTGVIHPVVSAISMSVSSLFVVLNSLRLKGG